MAITEIPISTGNSHQSIQTFPFFYMTALGLTLRYQMGRSDINDATSGCMTLGSWNSLRLVSYRKMTMVVLLHLSLWKLN